MERQASVERRRRFGVVAAVIGLTALSLTALATSLDSGTNPNSQPSTANHDVKAERQEAYPRHESITATVFWAGEQADASNDFIHNRSSAWNEDWQAAYGGVDDPKDRCGYHPCDFTPKENPFYIALPYNDLTDEGVRKPSAKNIPWYKDVIGDEPLSVVKNRWVKVTHEGKTAYAQWEDAGPFYYDDFNYVFGDGTPTSKRAGIDLSPAMATALKLNGRGKVSWEFVDHEQVPAGPWRDIITTSN